jgi:hypothetical protein
MRWLLVWELVSWSNESPASKDTNTESEEATVLEAVTRRQSVKTQQTGKTVRTVGELQECVN